MFAGAFIVRRRDNEGVVADANKLGIVRPQDLRTRDAHEAFQNMIGSRFGIPSGIEKRGGFHVGIHVLQRASAQRSAINSIPDSLGCTGSSP
jgi:hypothetical protein